MINRGCLLVLDKQLRQSLGRVAQEVQDAFNDGAVVIDDDLAMLCADEAKEALKGKSGRLNEVTSTYTDTLCHYSGLWLSETQTCH